MTNPAIPAFKLIIPVIIEQSTPWRRIATGPMMINATGIVINNVIKGTKNDRMTVGQAHINSKTFSSAFISLLAEENSLSNFFRQILLNRGNDSYLRLSTGDSPRIRSIARSLFLEQFRYDPFAPQCTTDWLRLLFSYVLREGQDNYSIPVSDNGPDITPVIKYLATNYKTTTLNELAAKYHYSPSYLSICIKETTGKTYSQMVKELKMADAVHYLETTKKSMEEISNLIGYNSVDQFSRTFRAYYGITPSKYRKVKADPNLK